MSEIGLDQDIDRKIVIAGEVQGDLSVAAGTKLVLAEDGVIHGNVRIAEGACALIGGEIQGDVIADGSVVLSENATIHGNVSGNVTSGRT